MTAIVHELATVPDVFDALRSVSDWPDALLFESAMQHETLGRHSFLTADPISRINPSCGSLSTMPGQLNALGWEYNDHLPPFQGGYAGFLGYEVGHMFERLPTPAIDDFALPEYSVGLYDWVLCWNHAQDKAWIIVQELPEEFLSTRTSSAAQRVGEIVNRLERRCETMDRVTEPRDLTPLTACHDLPRYPGVSSNYSREQYLQAVERVIEYIHAGDIFQANLSQRLSAKWNASSRELYHRLRSVNAAPFAGFYQSDDWAIVSASPERFLRMNGDQVETRPIKGTRRRRPRPEADLYSRDELRESDKDRAENVMIVDLLRNDLSRVCQPGSIKVDELCRVETYETVQHLVSSVCGTLREECNAWDLMAATFPGGSITGAPKIRAMEVIHELERVARGPYCGSLFYMGVGEQFDSNILIRTFIHRGGWVNFPVGGGIVAQSDPVAEYEETLDKAAGLLRALAIGGLSGGNV